QQRVALARALAISPDLLLLDEPLSALDARVRANLRMEIAALQRRLGITTIMVSHDQEEALTMADRIVVIDQGRVMQIGTPIEVYQTPATPFVANFVGLMNFLPGEISREETWKVVCGDNALLVPEGENPAAPGAPVTVAIRPEDVRVLDGEKHPPNVLVAQVEEVEFLGPYFRLHLELPSGTGQNGWLKLTTYIPPGQAHSTSLRKGARLAVYLPEHALRIFPRSGGRDDHPLLPDPGSRI
ncbi:MAG TPA: TOBE domain-containing protein, partial [Anaerolineales bacterium]|nr:TOBE domain-containing protein [Anaerolineales bacterium]